MSENQDGSDSAGMMPEVQQDSSFIRPESAGGFRERKAITVRHVEIARKLAISETFPQLEEMRHRLEALFMTDDTTRRMHRITDDDLAKAKEIFAVITAFMNMREINNGGRKFMSIPFTQTKELEMRRAFEEWLDPSETPYNFLIQVKDRLTEESAYGLLTKFCSKTVPYVLKLTVRISDALQLDEFDAAAGKVTLTRS